VEAEVRPSITQAGRDAHPEGTQSKWGVEEGDNDEVTVKADLGACVGSPGVEQL
jgi:hypothetical protein